MCHNRTDAICATPFLWRQLSACCWAGSVFRHHDISFSPGLIFVTAVQLVVELFVRLDVLNIQKRRAVLHDDWYVAVLDRHHVFNVLETLCNSTNIALPRNPDQIHVSYIIREEKWFWWTSNVNMFSCYNKAFSDTSMCYTRFVHFVQRFMDYMVTFEVDYNKQYLQTRTSDIAAPWNHPSSSRTPSYPLSSTTPALQMSSWKTKTSSSSIQSRESEVNELHEPGIVDLNETTIFSCNEKDAKLLVVSMKSCIENSAHFASFHVQCF